MAEQRSRRRRASDEGSDDTAPKRRRRQPEGSSTEDEDRPRQRRSRGRGSGMQLAQRARDAVAEMTGFEVENISGMERSEDGNWKVTVEVLEVSRIPDTDDMLGTYEAEIDENGELLGYARIHRYARSQANGPQSSRGH